MILNQPFAVCIFLMLVSAIPALGQSTPSSQAAAPSGNPAPCEAQTATDRVLRIEQNGDIHTKAGRLLKLADIRLAEGAPERLALFEDEDVLLSLDTAPDRWGRVAARMIGARDGQDAAELLLSEGLALVDAGEADNLCRPALLAVESEARAARMGAWTSVLLPASEPEALARRAGSFTVVEGTIVSIGERPRWTYLNFGRDFRRDFAVSISRRNWQAMQRAGLSSAELKGRAVRIRGHILMRRAPGMEITTARMIEFVDPPSSSSAPDKSEQ